MPTLSIQELIDMVKKDSAASQDHLAESIAELFISQGESLSDREKALMAGILRQLLDDVERAIRSKLADTLARAHGAPADIIEYLAKDEIDVARPILIHSDLLCDETLVEIIRHRTLEHQLAIAMRKTVSEQVSDALVDGGNERVILQLLDNQNAQISRKTMAYLVEQSRRVDSYQNPIVNRHDLPRDLAMRMYAWVSEALREKVVQKFNFDRGELDRALAASLQDVKAEDRATADATGELIDEVIGDKRPAPDEVIKFLRDGEIPLFEAAFARMVGIKLALVRRLIYEPGGEGVAVACRANLVPKSDFASIFNLSRQARPGDQSVQQGEVRRVLDLYDRLETANARSVFEAWQHDPDYGALRNGLKVALAAAA